MSTQPPDTLNAALALHAAGCSVIPVLADGSKHPGLQYAIKWGQYKDARAGENHLQLWFGNGHPGVGIVCGAISGNLEMLELEGRAIDERILQQLVDILEASGLTDLWKRITTGWLERSPSGGIHLHYRVDGAPVPGNTKLASRLAREDEYTDDERQVLERHPNKKILRGWIETRGEGGFVVTAPSHGTVHDTGKPYEVLAGGPDSTPVITAEEHQALHAVCRMLDAIPTDDNEPTAPAAANTGSVFSQPGAAAREAGGISPGDDFEAKTDWTDILGPHGWRAVYTSGHTRYWQRPGKTGIGASATTGRAQDRDRLYVFSSSTEFDTERPYTKFGAYAVLEHGGNHSTAARELKRRGFGAQPERHLKPVPHHRDSPSIPPLTDGTAALQIEPRPAAVTGSWPESFTDDGNALLFVDTYGERLRYVPQRGMWLVWDDYRWVWDEGNLVIELTRDMIRHLDPDQFADNEDILKAARRHKSGSLSRDKLSACVNLARSDRRAVAPAGMLDAEPRHLNTPGGIVDLTTGTLLPSDPAALHTRSTTVAPDDRLPTPRWNTFLTDTFGSNSEMAGFLQRLAGYSASADTGIHVLPFLHGGGQNGKSVLMDVLRQILGDYSAPAPAGFLMVGKQEHSEEMARLQGLRLVIASEVNQDAKFDEAKMKELTGGDTITARYMRQSFFTFEPTHHLWLMGNHQPQVKAGGESFWRRLRLVPFLNKVSDERKIENLAKILVAEEGPGILAWIVRGAVDVFSGGLRAPDAVMAATQLYAEEEDQIGRFLEERTLRGGGDQVRLETKKLRVAYESWCHGEGETPLSSSPFGRELKQRGITSKVSNSKRFYIGLSLLATDDEEPRWDDR